MSSWARRLFAFVILAVLMAAVGVRTWTAAQDPAEDVSDLVERGLYERAEVVARSELAQRRSVDALAEATASDALVRVLLLNGKGSQASTRSIAERALDIKQSRLGASHRDLAPSLINLGSALGEVAQHSRALGLLERAVALRQRCPRHRDGPCRPRGSGPHCSTPEPRHQGDDSPS
jgi:hypothetical protein